MDQQTESSSEPESELTPDPETEIELLFHALVDLSPQQASQRLRQLNLDDEQRECLEQMLAVDRMMCQPDQLESFFSSRLPQAIVAEMADATRAPGMSWRGRFQLLDEIGRGGMGVVYRAQDPQLGRHVAVKVILAGEHASAEEISLFEREAKAMASLHHPNIVTIYEFGWQGGESWFAMALLDGETLQARTAKGPIQPRSVAKIISDVAQAVAYAHQRNILHRDLKPANIFLQLNDTPVVTDFGISRVASDSEAREATQRGTLYYCAPERLSGQDGYASDIYSIGAILYACLTGRPPHFSAGDARTQILHGEIVPAKTINASIDADLNTICMKCLQREPQRRYASAAELQADLDRFLNNQPIVARPPSLMYRAQLAYRRNRLAFLGGGSAVVLLIIATAALGYAIARNMQSRVDQSERHLAQARTSRDQRGLGQRLGSLEHLQAAMQIRIPATEFDRRSLRNVMFESLCLTDLEIDKSWPSYSPDVCAVDKDFSTYASESPKGVLTVRRINTDEEAGEPILLEGRLIQIRFSDDGQKLGVVTTATDPANSHRLRIFDVNALSRCKLDERITGTAWQFLSTRAAVAYCRVDGKLIEHTFTDDSERLVVVGVWANDICYNGHEDRIVLTQGSPPFVKIFDSRSGTAQPAPQHSAEVRAVAWTKDGRLLATGNRSEVRIWEMPSCTSRDILRAHQTVVGSLIFNDDGCLLASHSWDGRTILWDVRTGSQLIGFSGTTSMSFHRDSSRFAGVRVGVNYGLAKLFSDDYCRLLQIADTADEEYRSTYDRGAWSVDFLPDHRLVAAAHLDGVTLFDPQASRTPLHTLEIGHCTVCRFLPDGSGFITSGKSGVHYWPIRLADDASTLEVGWPGTISRNPTLTGHTLSISSQSDVIAVMDQNRQSIHIEYMLEPSRSLDIPLNGPMDSVALHPQASSVAVGTWVQEPAGVQLFSLASASSDVTSAINISQEEAWPVFGPDGQLLLSTNSRHRALRINTSHVHEVFSIDCPTLSMRGVAAYSSSGRWIALNTDDASIQVVNAATGQEAITLKTRDVGTVTCLAFSQDETLLAASYQNRIVRVWDLQKAEQVLQPHRLNWTERSEVSHSSIPLTKIRLLDQRESQQLKYPPAFTMTSELPRIVEQRGTSIPKPNSETNTPYAKGYACAATGQWPAAAEQFRLAVENQPELAKHWYVYALVELRLGHFDEYRRACRAMVDRFGSSNNRQEQMYTTWTCALSDHGVDDLSEVLSIADTLVASAPLDPKGHTSRNTRGLLYLRMKKYTEARDELRTAIQIHSAGGNPSDWLALAMVEQEQGNLDKARELIEKADLWIEDRYHRPADARALPWHELLEYSLFREQARVRLGLVSHD